MPEIWRRHDLLRVKPATWPGILRSQPSLPEIACVTRWADSGWPLIVRRRAWADDPAMIPVGLPLPPGEGKRRLAFQFRPADVAERVAARTLRAARREVPPAWRPAVDAVLRLARRTKIEPRVFGSLLWQGLTGLPYLSAGSDLDLLWPVDGPAVVARIVRGLAEIEREGPVRFDGEFLLPDGSGVQWREWHGEASEVLVKNFGGVGISAVRDLFPRSGNVV